MVAAKPPLSHLLVVQALAQIIREDRPRDYLYGVGKRERVAAPWLRLRARNNFLGNKYAKTCWRLLAAQFQRHVIGWISYDTIPDIWVLLLWRSHSRHEDPTPHTW